MVWMVGRPDIDSETFCGAPFRAIREIGSGAHGRVFLAEGLAGRIAVKVCPRPDAPERQVDWERERRGWRLLARIPRYPGIVRVLDSGDASDGNAFWIAMELADPEEGCGSGGADAYRPLTLASVASAEVALPIGRCLSIGLRLASALEHLQRHHLLHRDVKPGNILFVRGRPVIADAGLVVDDREAASLVGTPGYEPPEHHGTPQGDVFSLGRTLWRIATGRVPEEAGAAPCAEADTSDPDFPALLDIVRRAMSDAPDRRYRSAKAMRKALARLRRQRALRRLRRMLVPVLACACAVLLLALVWALGRSSAFGRAAQNSVAGDVGPSVPRADMLGKFAEGAVMWYDFDDEANPLVDKSGAIGDATVVGATWKRDARGNGCFLFDGLPGYFDHPDRSPDADHDFIRVDDPSRVFPLSDFSISVVCRPENKGTIIGSGQNELWQREWSLAPGKFSWSWHPGHASGGVGRKTVDVRFPEQYRQLQHLVVRRTGKRLAIFRNGESVAVTNDFTELQLPVYSYGLFIGNMETDEFERYRRWLCFKGSIHHVMMWNRPLPDSEIGELWRTLDEKYGIARAGQMADNR